MTRAEQCRALARQLEHAGEELLAGIARNRARQLEEQAEQREWARSWAAIEAQAEAELRQGVLDD